MKFNFVITQCRAYGQRTINEAWIWPCQNIEGDEEPQES